MMDATRQAQYEKLYAQDGNVRCEALNSILKETDQPVDWAYNVWDKLVAQLQDENGHHRAIDHTHALLLQQVRDICLALPETEERLSHGEPTFFVGKKVFTMCANNHHQDGRIAVWIPVPPGAQAMLIDAAPQKFFKPPYVGVRGWVGIDLTEIDTEELAHHLRIAWRLIAPKRARCLLVD